MKEFCFFGVRALDETHSTSVNTGFTLCSWLKGKWKTMATLQCMCQWSDGKEDRHSDLEAASSPELSLESLRGRRGKSDFCSHNFLCLVLQGHCERVPLFCLKMGLCRCDLPLCGHYGLPLRPGSCCLTSPWWSVETKYLDQEPRKRSLWPSREKKVHVQSDYD